MKLVKWTRDDGMLVLLDRHKPIEMWLSIRGQIYDVHLEIGPFSMTWLAPYERHQARLAKAKAARADKEAARARHPAAQGK